MESIKKVRKGASGRGSLLDEAVAALRDKIKSLYETDSGDFKRKAILYLNRFEQSQMDQLEQKPQHVKIRQTSKKIESQGKLVERQKKKQEKLEILRRDILCREHSFSDERENVEALRAFILEGLQGL